MVRLFSAVTYSTDPYYNLALEEFLLSRIPENGVLLYLWQNAHTVVIGRNQNPWAECRLSLLEQDGGKLARRLSGGGAVYHDLGNVNFTFLCSEPLFDIPKQLQVVQQAAASLGIRAEFSGRNDLLADGCKFSGNAFYHSKGNAYHHGTLLVRTDMDRLQRYLSPPKAKLEAKGIASVRSRVVNLSEFSPGLTCEKMMEAMAVAFAQVYGADPAPFELTPEDLLEISDKARQYASHDWLFGKPLPFSCVMEDRLPFGQLQLQLQVENGVIRDLAVFSDAMDAFLPGRIAEALRGCPFRIEELAVALAELPQCDRIVGMIREQMP